MPSILVNSPFSYRISVSSDKLLPKLTSPAFLIKFSSLCFSKLLKACTSSWRSFALKFAEQKFAEVMGYVCGKQILWNNMKHIRKEMVLMWPSSFFNLILLCHAKSPFSALFLLSRNVSSGVYLPRGVFSLLWNCFLCLTSGFWCSLSGRMITLYFYLGRAEGQNTVHNWGLRKNLLLDTDKPMWKVPWEVLFERQYKSCTTFLHLCLWWEELSFKVYAQHWEFHTRH